METRHLVPRGRMAMALLLLTACLLGGCASAPQAIAPAALFQDAAFKPDREHINPAGVLALSPAMRQYLERDIANKLRSKGVREGLIDALYTKGQLQLEYDSTMTRNAAEAFDARSGNCLSLVIMTAAFAKELGLPVRYQSVFVEDTWSRNGDLYFISGHVNLSLGRRLSELHDSVGPQELLIDFLPRAELMRQRAQVIQENTIVAMYMNNRAAESLFAGDVDQAYWWAREAILQDPKLLAAYNTLGIIYRRHGQTQMAETALRYVLAQEPANLQAINNLFLVLRDQGRTAEAQVLSARLQELQPYPPYKFFDLGVQAMKAGDYKTAQRMFGKEIERAAYYHEFHFWLALANFGLGDMPAARKQMALALENSTTKRERAIYSAKLEWLNARRTGM